MDLSILEKLKPGMRLREAINVAEAVGINISLRRRHGEIILEIPGERPYVASMKASSDAGKSLISTIRKFALILQERRGTMANKTATEIMEEYIKENPGLTSSEIYNFMKQYGTPRGTVSGNLSRLLHMKPSRLSVKDNKYYHITYKAPPKEKPIEEPIIPEIKETIKVTEQSLSSLATILKEIGEGLMETVQRLEDAVTKIETIENNNKKRIEADHEVVAAVKLLIEALDKLQKR